ncbi:MAG: DUF3786 domain-containing protein [Lentisphaeria bacterium]|nr:DUF3786 domain-containing protein [Lentisphaeria bacterium]
MPKDTAYQTAISRAIADLEGVELSGRCRDLGLPEPSAGLIHFRMFGNDGALDTKTFALTTRQDSRPVKPADQILLLHYLLCSLPIEPTDELIAFREFPAGQFYLQAFQSRSTAPLAQRFGNDLGCLRQNLSRFDWEPAALGDFGARIHAYGNLHVTLVYHLGDDEFPAEAKILFDTSAKRVLDAEEAAVLAGRICIGLL